MKAFGILFIMVLTIAATVGLMVVARGTGAPIPDEDHLRPKIEIVEAFQQKDQASQKEGVENYSNLLAKLGRADKEHDES